MNKLNNIPNYIPLKSFNDKSFSDLFSSVSRSFHRLISRLSNFLRGLFNQFQGLVNSINFNCCSNHDSNNGSINPVRNLSSDQFTKIRDWSHNFLNSVREFFNSVRISLNPVINQLRDYVQSMMCFKPKEKSGMRLFMRKDSEGTNWFIDQDGTARKQLTWKEIASSNKVNPVNNQSNNLLHSSMLFNPRMNNNVSRAESRMSQSRMSQSRMSESRTNESRTQARLLTGSELNQPQLFEPRNGDINSRVRRERRISSVVEQSDTLSIESITSAVLEALGDLPSPSSDPELHPDLHRGNGGGIGKKMSKY